jgi:hypothetical protein
MRPVETYKELVLLGSLIFTLGLSVISSCGEALKKNKDLITEEQIPYQKELRRNYKALHDKLDPLLKNRFGTLRGSMGMRKK